MATDVTTAREQARKAARQVQFPAKMNPSSRRAELDARADAASDVWEPLLREAFEYRSRTVPLELEDRLRQALGEE